MRYEALGDGQHLVGAGHLEVERSPNRGFEAGYIVILYVTTILAQVRGDSIGARVLTEARGVHRIGFGSATCLTNGCHMIDVDAEPQVHSG